MATAAITRGAFLRLAAGAGAGAALGGAPARAAGRMVVRRIPKTGATLRVVGLGTARVFDVDRAAREPQRQVVQRLFEAGGAVIDTSPMYGRAERVIGGVLADLGAREHAFLATKVWTQGRDRGIAQMRESMRLMRTDRIELMQVHNLVDWQTQLGTLRRWKEQGTLRHIGVTHWTRNSVQDLARIVAAEKLDFVQLPYSLGMREAEKCLLPLCADKGVATLVNRPFVAGGLFRQARGRSLPPWAKGELGVTTWAQYFLKYVLGHPAVTCVIPGTAKPRHARDNFAAGLGPLPDARQHAKLLTDWQRI